ncbi:hypothetical protein FB446DRAFT_792569 [Lentinula raphanica]|nr:hypothetical protein FB446DRAFT_792569 [Lentinula raphanica]
MSNGRSNTNNKRKRAQSKPRPAKRARATQTTNVSDTQPVKMPREFMKVRGKFASLEAVTSSLPLEIVFEVFSWLDPRDLLSLSRTSKYLRDILLSKSSESIWRTARINFKGGLPPLPQDLNEPQFARLIFDVWCHVCNKSFHCENVLWKFRLRCCRSCEKSLPQWTQLKIPRQPFVILSILPKENITVGKSNRIVYHRPLVSKMIEQFLALSSEEDRLAWVDQKRQDLQVIEQHARLCKTWHEAKLEQHARELRDVRKQRLQAILTRLQPFGLDSEAQCILSGRSEFEEASVLTKLCLLNQSKQLTDQGWNNIEPDLVEMLSKHKRKRLRQEHLKDLRDPFPGVGDILTDPILEALIWDTAKEEELTPAFLRSRLLDELPRISSQWRILQTQKLVQILKTVRHDATESDLQLATTIFGNRASRSRSDDRMRAVNALYDTVGQEGPWSSRSLFIHSLSSRLVERIVVGAGLDPSTTTTRELTIAHPLIECTGHQASFFPGQLFVTWPAALTHNLSIQDEVFFAINRFGEESSAIRAKEPVHLFMTVRCAHCHGEISYYELPHHLHSAHNVDTLMRTVTDIHSHFDTHWYWNPQDSLNFIGMDFRY